MYGFAERFRKNKMKTVILIGGFIETIELCEKCGYDILGIADLCPCSGNRYTFIGTDTDLIRKSNKYKKIPLVIAPDDPLVREKLFKLYYQNGFHFETVISPDATISPSALIGEGCLIQSGSNISSKVFLGRGVRVNTGANVMHEVHVGDFSTIAPNAVVLGKCQVGKNVYVGANSTLLPECNIGNGSIVGAGAVVTKNIKDKVVAVGNPARLRKELVE